MFFLSSEVEVPESYKHSSEPRGDKAWLRVPGGAGLLPILEVLTMEGRVNAEANTTWCMIAERRQINKSFHLLEAAKQVVMRMENLIDRGKKYRAPGYLQNPNFF